MNTETLERSSPAMMPPQSDSSPIPEESAPSNNPPSPFQEVKEAAGEQITQVAANLKENGSEALQTAKDAGSNYIDEQKEKLAGQIVRYTEAVKAACETLQNGDANLLVSPGQRASRQMERAAEYLRNHDAKDFLNDLGDLARRRPEIVFGGLFVAGLASVRFLKASSRENSRSPRDKGAGSNSYQERLPLRTDGNKSDLSSNFEPNPFQ